MVSASRRSRRARRRAAAELDRKRKDNFCYITKMFYNIEKDTCPAIQRDFCEIYTTFENQTNIINLYNKVCDIKYVPPFNAVQLLKTVKSFVLVLLSMPLIFVIYSFYIAHWVEIFILTLIGMSYASILLIVLGIIKKLISLIV